MTELKDIIKDIPKHESGDGEDVMMNPDYVRQSSKFISDSLRKGHDVLQLDNGDIVTTQTKTITVQYTWDDEKKKMVRKRSGRRGRRPKSENQE